MFVIFGLMCYATYFKTMMMIINIFFSLLSFYIRDSKCFCLTLIMIVGIQNLSMKTFQKSTTLVQLVFTLSNSSGIQIKILNQIGNNDIKLDMIANSAL